MSNLQPTATLKHVMAEAKGYADAREHECVRTEHILLALLTPKLSGSAREILTTLGTDLTGLTGVAEEIMQPAAAPWGTTRARSGVRPHATELPYSTGAGAALMHAMTLATNMEATAMHTGHMLAGLLHDPKSPAGAGLTLHGVTYDDTVRILTTSPEKED